MRRSVITRTWTLLAAVAIVAGACSSPPTAEPDEPATGGGGSAEEAEHALTDVYAQLEGLDPEARREKLIELAKEEGGEVTWYAQFSDAVPFVEAFERDTGVKVNLYRADSRSVAARVLQEHQAGQYGADVLNTDVGNAIALKEAGALLPLDSPFKENLLPEVVDEVWMGPTVNSGQVMWNTDLIPAGEEPRSYEDVFTKYAGQFALDTGDWDKLTVLITDYFVAEKGMTEEEALDFVKQGIPGAQLVNGHSLARELLKAGQFPIVLVNYTYYIKELQEEGAPVGWAPILEPLVATPHAEGVVAETEHPAAALLLVEYMVTDGQTVMIDLGLPTVNPDYAAGGAIDLSKVEVISTVNDQTQDPEQARKWQDTYRDILDLAGTEPLEEEE